MPPVNAAATAEAPDASAARAFREFFEELRDVFLERETVLAQIELALLCREHVLITGPPGTAKSAIAGAVLSRILDEKTAQPSLFSKQLSESTVQTDLIGPVDFKVLTETGRTEYITEDGMLGANHAFLDEVFDGRDMLLRSILNVLHERELKQGRRRLEGRFECALMTSNRYLSEVLARSPELLLAFADRLSFIAFVPKSFARATSRAAMLDRASKGQKPELRAHLSLQQVDVLQGQVERVTASGQMLEALEILAETIERELQAQVVKLPDYVPTKYFSHRSVVKALWALKAAVVRDRVYHRPDRRLEVELSDFEALRWFFLLGGPAREETEALLRTAVDPRERAQLEIIRLEHKIFDEALGKVREQLSTAVEREAASLNARADLQAAEALARGYSAEGVSQLARSLRAKLRPGPRHAENRELVLAAARTLAMAFAQRLARGMAGQGEGRGGLVLLASMGEVLELCRQTPELRSRLPELCKATARFASQSLEMIALSAESAQFDEALRLDALVGLAENLEDELAQTRVLAMTLERIQPETAEAVRRDEQAARSRASAALRRQAVLVLPRSQARPPAPAKGRGGPDNFDVLLQESRRLERFEAAMVSLDPAQAGVKQELLATVARGFAAETVGVAPFNRLDQYVRAVQALVESLKREGLDPNPVLAEHRTVIERRVGEHVQHLARGIPSPQPPGAAVVNGEAYVAYRQGFNGTLPDGELESLLSLEQLLVGARAKDAVMFFSNALKEQLALVELSALQSRIKYLRSWLNQLLQSLPAPEAVKERAAADRAFDHLVQSRFPLLAVKEGELIRLRGALEALTDQPGAVGDGAKKLEAMVKSIGEDFGLYSKRLLDSRAVR